MPPRPTTLRATTAIVVAALLLQPRVSAAVWRLNAAGECVREWTPASLLRGPTAIVNAPLLPFRTAAGGVETALEDPTPNPGVVRRVALPPLLAVVGGGIGLVDAVVWIATGLADTFTGGWFELVPDEATELGIAPVRPPLGDTRAAPKPKPRCPR